MALVVEKDQFYCSICVEVLKEPVTLPCGHTYCSSCIQGAWDQEAEEKRLSTCPQCRETFCPRPALRTNHLLAEVVDKLKTPGVHQSSVSAAPLHYAGPADVACDLCPGSRRHKALMSCLGCQVSYCEAHLQAHHEKHKLVPPTATPTAPRPHLNMCSSHNKPMEVFCRTEQQCICLLCAMDEHKGHDTVSAAAERSHRQKQLGTSQQNLHQKIQGRKKEVKELIQLMETLESSAEAAVEDSEQMFSEMKACVDRRHVQVKDTIRQQEKTAVSQVQDVLRHLEEHLAQLERTHAELDTLSNTDDNVHFIQSVQCASSSSAPPVLPSDVESTLTSFTQLREDMSALRDKLDLVLNTPWTHTESPADVSQPEDSPADVSQPEDSPADVSHPAEPQTREELLQYSCPLSLDVNRVHNNFSLSEENRKVTRQQTKHPPHSKRFLDNYPQVLSRDSLTERYYWEVEWNEHESIDIAVSYEDISRYQRFGSSSDSWCLKCLGDDCWFTHDSIDTKVTKPSTSSTRVETKAYGWQYPHSFTRVGVYLDHKAGTLSFYSVRNNTLTHLYTVHTTFTQPLYAGIGMHGPCDHVNITGKNPQHGGFSQTRVVLTAEVCKIW